jgi:arabinogalactan endo-1,4-beta-galactosidase
MKASDAIDLLKNNSVFWSRMGFFHDPPLKDENGRMVIFGDNFEHFGKFHQDFTAAGIKIHTSILFNGWIWE